MIRNLATCTDWPHVESDRGEWEEWVKSAPPANTIHVCLLGEPQGKGRPRSRIAKTRDGREYIAIYTPRATVKYEEALALAGKTAMKRRPPLTGPVKVHVLAVMSVPPSWSQKKKNDALHGTVRPTVSPDWDNIGKVLDAFNGIVWDDDKQIVFGSVEKAYGQLPRLEVQVTPITTDGLFST